MKRSRSNATVTRGRRRLALALAGFAALAAAVIGGSERLRPTARPAPIAFELIDQDGRAVTPASFSDKWLLVYFGYTHCPDACPTALNDIAEALDRLGARRAKVQPLFVTLDPERDTLDVLKPYTATFQAGIVGLTGAPEHIAALAKAYQVEYRREPGRAGGYDLDHSSTMVLVDPAGRAVARFSHETPPAAIQAKLAQVVS
jgi:cytochrome oxidase Cu insertion factor (SCO1/SenC/PrrC family)